MRRVVLALFVAAFACLAIEARADDLGVTRVRVTEKADGAIDIFAFVPARFARALPAPELVGHGVFDSRGYDPRGGVRWVLPPRATRLGPGDVLFLPWQRQAVLARVRLADGTSTQRFFRRKGRGIDVPLSSLRSASVGVRDRIQRHALDGVRHVLTSPWHVLLAALIGVLGGFLGGARALFHFHAGHLLAVPIAASLGLHLPAVVGEMGLLVILVLLARELMRPRPSLGAFGVVMALAGVVHGLALSSVVLLPDGAWALVVVTMGIDGAHVALGLTAAAAARAVGSRVRWRGAFAAGLGVVSVALLVLFALGDGRADAWTRSATPEKASPELVDASSVRSRSTPASRLASRPTSDAPLQAYLAVEPFEVRLDVLLGLRDVAAWAGWGPDEVVPIDAQEALLERLAGAVRQRCRVLVDGREVETLLERVDFVTAGPRGILPRVESVAERLEQARVGLVLRAGTAGIPDAVEVRFENLLPTIGEIPAAVTDPERSVASTLDPAEPVLRWQNELQEDPIPKVEALRRAMPRLPIPWIALLVLAGAALLARRPGMRRAVARVLLAVALILAPVAPLAVPLPTSLAPAPRPEEAGRIVDALLTNVYRSFAYREEAAVYDRLALSVGGEQLAEIYLEQSRALELAERGGARAQVESVEVLDVGNIEKTENGGFVATVAWTVGGSVSHFGHRHFRQNRYDARIRVEPDADVWKIRSVEILDQRRVL